MSTRFYDGIVWNGNKPFILERTTVEIGRIVVITSDEKNPVVRLIHTLGVLLDNIFIIASVFKTKSAVSSHNEKRIFHLILHAHFVHEKIEISVNISRNDDGLAFRKFIYVIVYIIHVVFFSNTGEAFAE